MKPILATVVGVFLSVVGISQAAVEPAAAERSDSSPAARVLPGLRPEGNILLPTQWSLRPTGEQLEVGDFPVHIALHPSGRWAAVLCAGYGDHEVVIVDLQERRKVSRVIVPQAFYGVAYDQAGEHLYASGGETEVVHGWSFADGSLSEYKKLVVGPVDEARIPAGLALSDDGKTLFVACCWGDSLSVLLTDGSGPAKHIALGERSYPYAVILAPGGKTAYVSLWAQSAVAEVDLATGTTIRKLATDSHPTEMLFSPDGKLLYVACANSNMVTVVDLQSGEQVEAISSALYPNSPNGSTPNSISLSRDGKTLLVANADNNNVAVIDVSERGRSRSLGLIPVGWYPTSVRFAGDDKIILVANGKGLWPKPNRHGPKPTQSNVPALKEYIGGLFEGTVGFVQKPNPQEMAALTRRAFSCSPLRRDAQARSEQRSDNHPIPGKVGSPSPIKHCIYIIKENRTYDQVLGDIQEGNGDASLCLFPEAVTPNHHALVRQFVLLDNFYVEGEVSADGHEWSMAAYATDFVEKLWPLDYRTESFGKIGYVSEGVYPIATPQGGYLWDRAREADVSYYSFGEFIKNAGRAGEPSTAAVAALEGHFDPLFRGFDLNYTDADRATRFIEKLKEFETKGEMPRLIIMRLPNDHTSGTSPGKPTPTAMVADNDLALGRVVEAISHSKFWPETAVFVVEDDAQNGSDHVDAHRTVAMVISPYTKRGVVDSSFYSTSSMLRTMELILGLEPMSQFDAAALPMYASFQEKADLTPTTHRPVSVDLNAKNPAEAWGASLSEQMDLTQEDRADDLLLNEVVWRSVRGADSPMPPPVRAAFFLAEEEE
ncbi:MAG: beta-propeller fold lactonase family protein [Planctomycetes bacterium]|nr:beta-propeller fold lactonase family protein [Planctomycetota bacterium]